MFKVDQRAEIFQTLFGWAKDDVEGRPDGRVYNLATQTKVNSIDKFKRNILIFLVALRAACQWLGQRAID